MSAHRQRLVRVPCQAGSNGDEIPDKIAIKSNTAVLYVLIKRWALVGCLYLEITQRLNPGTMLVSQFGLIILV
jgi:hypothetical protein